MFIFSAINFFFLWNNFRKNKIKNINYNASRLASNYSINTLINKFSFGSLLFLRSIVISLTYIFSSNKYLKRLVFIYLLFGFGLGLFVESLSLHLAHDYYYTPTQIGKFFVIMFIVMAISMCLLQELIAKYVNYKAQIKLGLLSISILLILGVILRVSISDIFLINYTYITWIITIAFYVFIPFPTLGFTNLFANSVSKKEQGKIMSSAGQISSIGLVAAGLIIGKLMTISYNFILLISGISFTLSYIMINNLISHDSSKKLCCIKECLIVQWLYRRMRQKQLKAPEVAIEIAELKAKQNKVSSKKAPMYTQVISVSANRTFFLFKMTMMSHQKHKQKVTSSRIRTTS